MIYVLLISIVFFSLSHLNQFVYNHIFCSLINLDLMVYYRSSFLKSKDLFRSNQFMFNDIFL